MFHSRSLGCSSRNGLKSPHSVADLGRCKCGRDRNLMKLHVLSPPPVFWLAGKFFFAYSALACSINFCLCSNSLLAAAAFAAEDRLI